MYYPDQNRHDFPLKLAVFTIDLFYILLPLLLGY